MISIPKCIELNSEFVGPKKKLGFWVWVCIQTQNPNPKPTETRAKISDHPLEIKVPIQLEPNEHFFTFRLRTPYHLHVVGGIYRHNKGQAFGRTRLESVEQIVCKLARKRAPPRTKPIPKHNPELAHTFRLHQALESHKNLVNRRRTRN